MEESDRSKEREGEVVKLSYSNSACAVLVYMSKAVGCRVPSHESVLRCVVMRAKEAKVYFCLFHFSHDASQKTFIWRHPDKLGCVFSNRSRMPYRVMKETNKSLGLSPFSHHITPLNYTQGSTLTCSVRTRKFANNNGGEWESQPWSKHWCHSVELIIIIVTVSTLIK